jgi:hypothetical protein
MRDAVIRPERFRRSEHDRFSWRAQLDIRSVYLVANGGVHHQAVIADGFLIDSIEDVTHSRIHTLGGTFITHGPSIDTLGGEAHTKESVWQLATVTPVPTQLSGRAVMKFPGFRLPRAGPVVSTSHLDDVRTLSMHTGDPIEAVSPKVHDASTGVDPAFDCFEDLAGPIFGMTTRDEDLVAFEEVSPLFMEI